MKCLLECMLCYELEWTEDEDLPFRSQVCFDCKIKPIKQKEELYETTNQVLWM